MPCKFASERLDTYDSKLSAAYLQIFIVLLIHVIIYVISILYHYTNNIICIAEKNNKRAERVTYRDVVLSTLVAHQLLVKIFQEERRRIYVLQQGFRLLLERSIEKAQK